MSDLEREMGMGRWMVVPVAVAALGVAGLALAQGPTASSERGPFTERGGRARNPSPEDRAAFADARIAALKAGLRLTAEQERHWPPFEEAIRGVARQRADAQDARRERAGALQARGEPDFPGQIRQVADRQAASAAALGRLADAAAPLHATLDDGQRRRLTILSRFIRPGMGWEPGRGRRGEYPMRGGGWRNEP